MNQKSALLFLLVITVFVLGAFALYTLLRASPANVPDVTAAVVTETGDNMNLQTKTDAAIYPVAPRVDSETWLNSPKLNWDDLRGKVVLVEFWTFGCSNCQNVIPSVRGWYNQYANRGLVVIGVHSPEFQYEHDVKNIQDAIQRLNVPYPVAVDNDFRIWNSYHTWAWPSMYLIDKQGRVRYTHVGEGAYEETEKRINELLQE